MTKTPDYCKEPEKHILYHLVGDGCPCLCPRAVVGPSGQTVCSIVILGTTKLLKKNSNGHSKKGCSQDPFTLLGGKIIK